MIFVSVHLGNSSTPVFGVPINTKVLILGLMLQICAIYLATRPPWDNPTKFIFSILFYSGSFIILLHACSHCSLKLPHDTNNCPDSTHLCLPLKFPNI